MHSFMLFLIFANSNRRIINLYIQVWAFHLIMEIKFITIHLEEKYKTEQNLRNLLGTVENHLLNIISMKLIQKDIFNFLLITRWMIFIKSKLMLFIIQATFFSIEYFNSVKFCY